MNMDGSTHDTPTYTTKQDKIRFYNSGDWERIRQQALDRDRHECTWCAARGEVTTKEIMTLEVDHIQEIETHPHLSLDLDNLRTLCRRCHNKRHNRLQFRPTKKVNKWADDESFD